MPLTGQQTAKLADVIDQELNPATLDLIATDLGVNLKNLLPGASVKEWAVKLIEEMNGRLPAADGQLLDRLTANPNANLRAVAAELLRPGFLSPTVNPLDAIVLGETAFIDRAPLRTSLKKFINPSLYTTRVLIVRGEEPCGKSYSWQFLQHLAFSSVGAQAHRLQLKKTNYTPRQFLEQAWYLLRFDPPTLPALADSPQLAKIDPLINAFKGQLDTLSKRYWLVIDDLNEPNVTPEIRETAYAMACAVEEEKPENLWIALLGYNEPVTGEDLLRAAIDDAEFPTANLVANHLEMVAQLSGNTLAKARAQEIANLLFKQYPKLNRDVMSQLRLKVEQMGEKLRQGLQP